MMQQTPIVSHLCGFTVALNNEKKKLVKFHFRNPLINIHQKSFTFLIFCVSSLSPIPIPVSMSHSHRHAVFLNVSVCAFTKAPSCTLKLKVQFGIFCSIQNVKPYSFSWWLHHLNSMQNLSVAVMFGISSVLAYRDSLTSLSLRKTTACLQYLEH